MQPELLNERKMDKQILKQILRDNQQEIERYVVEPRDIKLGDFPCRVLVGVRRAGKSYMLYHVIQQLLAQGHKWDEMLYLSFEDERLENFDTDDFAMYRIHQSGHTGRQKMRFRTYVSSDLQFLEVKTKNNHGRTKKKRIKVFDMDLDEFAGRKRKAS